jgi:hypothetical protein
MEAQRQAKADAGASAERQQRRHPRGQLEAHGGGRKRKNDHPHTDRQCPDDKFMRKRDSHAFFIGEWRWLLDATNRSKESQLRGISGNSQPARDFGRTTAAVKMPRASRQAALFDSTGNL